MVDLTLINFHMKTFENKDELEFWDQVVLSAIRGRAYITTPANIASHAAAIADNLLDLRRQNKIDETLDKQE